MSTLNCLCFWVILGISTVLGCTPRYNVSKAKTTSLYPPPDISIPYHSDWTKNHYPERIAHFQREPLTFGDIVFLGNSITEGGDDWGAKLGIPQVRNRGIAGDVTDGVLKRLDEITFFKPKAVFVLIGINDLFNGYYQKGIPSAAYVGNNIIHILETIHRQSPRTKIYAQTILPTAQVFMQEPITTVNAMILAREKKNVFEVIDLHAAFVDERGLMKKELTTDGTHLNEKGYAVWVDLIRVKIFGTR